MISVLGGLNRSNHADTEAQLDISNSPLDLQLQSLRPTKPKEQDTDKKKTEREEQDLEWKWKIITHLHTGSRTTPIPVAISFTNLSPSMAFMGYPNEPLLHNKEPLVSTRP